MVCRPLQPSDACALPVVPVGCLLQLWPHAAEVSSKLLGMAAECFRYEVVDFEMLT